MMNSKIGSAMCESSDSRFGCMRYRLAPLTTPTLVTNTTIWVLQSEIEIDPSLSRYLFYNTLVLAGRRSCLGL